jgi:dihydroflavonol-4-reductase
LKALVLGATGFIGGHIALAALRDGWQVRGYRRDPHATGNLTGEAIEWYQGRLEDEPALAAAMQGVDVVFHAAAYYPTRQDRRPVIRQAEFAREQINRILGVASNAAISRFVYTSSLTTIGHPPPGAKRLANETDFYVPGSFALSGYYESKFAMEAAVLKATSDGFPAIVLNPTAVFGPGDIHLTLSSLLVAVARGRALAWLPAKINVVDARDVASAHIAAVEKGVNGQRYILGGHNMDVRSALSQAAAIAGVPAPRFELPLAWIDRLIRLDDALPFVNITGNHLRAIREWQAFDTGKSEQELSLSSRPFEETLRDAFDWLRQHHKI